MTLNLIGIGVEITDLTTFSISLVLSSSKVLIFDSKYLVHKKDELEKILSIETSLISTENLDENLASALKELYSSKGEYSLLFPGNPFCENHFPKIQQQCENFNISIKVVHNCSYRNIIGNSGIQLYKFGRTIFVENLSQENIDAYVDIINLNMERHLNTHILFDKSDTRLGTQMISILSELSSEKKLFKVTTYLVVLYHDETGRHFDYFSINSPNEHQSIESVAVCVELDCIEEEYLREMKNYIRNTREKNKENGSFNIVGLGLGKPSDITLKGKKLIEHSDKIFLEGYTSIMLGGKDKLQSFFQKDIVEVDRETVEQRSAEILDHLRKGENVSFLVVGDPFGATTHADIILRSLKQASDIVIANNASIINSIGISGLKPSKFGGIVSIPFWSDSYKPSSFYNKILANYEIGLHTLCLLDIQVKEQSVENLIKGRKIYEKPRFMSVSDAAQQLLSCRDNFCGKPNDFITENSLVVCLLRIGTEFESIVFNRLGDLPSLDQGEPLHSLIIVGKMDEEEILNKI